MHDKLKETLIARYKADIADATYKIKCFNDHEIVIPEHFDITGEVDKLLYDSETSRLRALPNFF